MSRQFTVKNSIELECKGCRIKFRKHLNDYRAAIKQGQVDFYHDRTCKISEVYQIAANKKWESKRTTLACDFCKKSFTRRPSDMSHSIKAGTKHFFCCVEHGIYFHAKEKSIKASTPEALKEKLLRGVIIPEDPNACWIYQGVKDERGYGRFYWSAKEGHTGAHRASYRLFEEKEIPPNHVINHLCCVPSCINPQHLEAVSQRENMEYSRKLGRNARGEGQFTAKLTEEQVREIRHIWATDKFVTREYLANRFDVSIKSISRVVNRYTWRHI